MLKHITLNYKNSGVLNTLVLNYLNRDQKLAPLYSFFPDKKGFEDLIKSGAYNDFDRNTLSEILLKQSGYVENASGNSVKNIYKLKEKNTFTVTTGHQLCLFTGPLYFIYKIVSTINLAEALKKQFPEHDFVPVYWMASEDHDFAEINNFSLFGKTLIWESAQTGAVGDFKTDELKNILPQLAEILGKSDNATYLTNLFEASYLKHKTLADATRFLVNELFGEYGVVTLDGNDKQFKQQFTNEFKKDIFENSAAALVHPSVKELETLGYSSQVNPRDINCFYIENGLRTRIEKKGDDFNLVGTETSFTKQELEDIIDNSPEKISPNVVLRPLYQQKILPNIAYIGGPGELAYWLEFKKLFEGFKIQLPVLMPRNFICVIDKPTQTKIDKLNFSGADFFKSEKDLVNDFQVKTNNVFAIDSEKETLSGFYNSLIEKASAIDKTLSGSLAAELKKSLNGLDIITGKANKALKLRSETEINQIKSIKYKLFPESVPQERSENFATFYLKHGRNFIKEIKAQTDPFLLEQYLFTEE